jgi:glycine reductase
MKLEIGNFYVKDIVFGENNSFENGILTINKQQALDFVMEDEHITGADLVIVKPGDEVRLVPVKEAIEPRVKVDGRTLFPG